MELHYNKNDNSSLFTDFNNSDLVNIENPQSFIPLYTNFFSLNDTNYNNINLNHKFSLSKITKKISENKYIANLKDHDSNTIKDNKPVFFKLSSLYDPIKFMIGKYDKDTNYLTLPTFSKKHQHKKLDDPNNAAYVDSFFTYLTSQILHKYNFIHGVDFYGSFLGIKNNYKFNVFDDLDYLQDSSYFIENNNVPINDITFSIDPIYFHADSQNQSRSKREKLIFLDDEIHKDKDNNNDNNNGNNNDNNNDNIVLTLSDISDIEQLDTIFKKVDTSPVNDIKLENLDLMFECKANAESLSQDETDSNSSSSCSSRSSNTEDDSNSETCSDSNSCLDDTSDSGSECSGSECSGSECSGSSYETESSIEEEQIDVNISKFPIQLIALEQCEETLDHLLTHNEFSTEEWDSLVIQILMILITYQKVFDLTHNDLHTNNIMYNTTDKQFLNYRFNGKYYKIPTFGRIYKIIDFGRAIYKFRGKRMCSDSFHPKGDAATQYNCEPYINPKKPILEPNKSFDLCRLGCSLFDFILDELEDDDIVNNLKDIPKISSKIKKIMLEWCNDDKGRNVIYKANGEERYPEFKLYKMIARTVNKHIPSDVLQHKYFSKYIFPKKKINTKKLMDIDSYPDFE